MRLEFHGEELLDRFMFRKIPDGEYVVRTTAYPDNEEAFDFMWPVTIKDGTLTAHQIDDPRQAICVQKAGTGMPLISVVCPVYEMQGRGVEMLRELIASIRMQMSMGYAFTDYEVIISDSSTDNRIANYHTACLAEPVYYLRNHQRGAAANFNNAIDHASGEIIKPMCQDDKFMEPDTLQKISDAFKTEDTLNRGLVSWPQWIACTSHNAGEPEFREYDHVPYPHRDLHSLRTGENTYGSPSAMAWRKNDLRFDENLNWLLDCEFYARMAERYGVPTFVDTLIYIRQWSGQVTHQIGGHQRILDTNYVIEKYR